MAYKPPPEEPKKGAPEYMNTYGDLVTLMLTFFVLLFSMSSLDVEKFKALADSFRGTASVLQGGSASVMPDAGDGLMPSDAAPNEEETLDPDVNEEAFSGTAEELEAIARANAAGDKLNDMASEFETYFAENTALQDIQVNVEDTILRLTFPGTMLFDSGQAYLDGEAEAVIDEVAVLLAEYPDYGIIVEGHTDDVPMSANSIYPSNRHLSSARADTIIEYLIGQHGFDPMTIKSEGMGEYWPLVPNDSAANRALNRRVEIKMEAIREADGTPIDSALNLFGA